MNEIIELFGLLIFDGIVFYCVYKIYLSFYKNNVISEKNKIGFLNFLFFGLAGLKYFKQTKQKSKNTENTENLNLQDPQDLDLIKLPNSYLVLTILFIIFGFFGLLFNDTGSTLGYVQAFGIMFIIPIGGIIASILASYDKQGILKVINSIWILIINFLSLFLFTFISGLVEKYFSDGYTIFGISIAIFCIIYTGILYILIKIYKFKNIDKN